MTLRNARHLLLLSLTAFALSACSNKKNLAKIHDLETQLETLQEETTNTTNDLNRRITENEDAARNAQAEAAQQIRQLTTERDAATQQLAKTKAEFARAEEARIAKLPKDASVPGHPEFNPAKETKITNALVTISGDKSAGTGFVVNSSGKYYLYTSASTLAGNSRLTITNAEGTKFTKFGNLEVAEKTSVVRLEILEPNALPALSLAEEDAKVGSDTPVTILATEAASGGVTSSSGNAQGQSEENINIEFSLLHGKTGGPLLETATGKVLAIIIDPAAEPQHQLWVEPAGTGDPDSLRATRLNHRVLWKAVPVATFLAEAKKIADYNRLTGVAQAFAGLNTTPGLGLTLTIAGSRTGLSILTAAKDLPIAAETITLHDDIAAKRVRLGEADLKKRIASIISSAVTQLQRGEADFVPAKFNPYHRPYAEEAQKWHKDAVKLLSGSSTDK